MSGNLAAQLARLRAAAIIAPNFSFFIGDVPRTHTLYNRKRICLAAQKLSDAGCRVILPLNAVTANDWDFWYGVLRDNPSITYVAKEFQTGLSGPILGGTAIKRLAEMQDRLRRSLHPVALGAYNFRRELRQHFNSHTIIDSRPFMLTVSRRQTTRAPSGRYVDAFTPTSSGQPLDHLLNHNIRMRSKRLKEQPPA
jgi:hypothetical protein